MEAPISNCLRAPNLVTLTYRKLIEVAGETVIDGELCLS
jgi:hypothetical protein